jgi:protein gp37
MHDFITRYSANGGPLGPFLHNFPRLWLGVSAERQEEADARIPWLLKIPATVRFVSFEPLLGPIILNRLHATCPEHDFDGGFCSSPCRSLITINWAIIGGESGPGARPFDLAWARSLLAQCRVVGVPAFMKQVGGHPHERRGDRLFCRTRQSAWKLLTGCGSDSWSRSLAFQDPKGGDPTEWPEDLRVREWPEVS